MKRLSKSECLTEGELIQISAAYGLLPSQFEGKTPLDVTRDFITPQDREELIEDYYGDQCILRLYRNDMELCGVVRQAAGDELAWETLRQLHKDFFRSELGIEGEVPDEPDLRRRWQQRWRFK
jgi:hypothetical protein